MGIFSWFSQKPPALPKLDHPIFGKLVATIDHGDGTFFWETQEQMQTSKGKIGIFCDAPDSGPSENQVSQWMSIYANFEYIRAKSEKILIDRLEDFGLESRIDEMIWSAVGLSIDGSMSSPWDISFDLDCKIFTAYFEDGKPKLVTCDD
ncbi:MAG: hypothetical protein ABL926_08915 [Novosphingobium sp.]|uniref:hypothetical protein n=1 Tax=Novosphingobium sp. TaxID=1874826 RepID=UPI0032B7CA50